MGGCPLSWVSTALLTAMMGPPRAEVGLLGKLYTQPQAIEHGIFFRHAFEEAGIEIEEGAIGGVVRAPTPFYSPKKMATAVQAGRGCGH